MKLQRRLSRRYKGKEYYKFIIVIPEGDIKRARLKEGDELMSEVKEGEISLKRNK